MVHSTVRHEECLSSLHTGNDRGTEAGCDDVEGREMQLIIAGSSAFSWAQSRAHRRRSFE